MGLAYYNPFSFKKGLANHYPSSLNMGLAYYNPAPSKMVLVNQQVSTKARHAHRHTHMCLVNIETSISQSVHKPKC